MKTSKVIGLSIALCSTVVASVAAASENLVWSVDKTTCATSIVPGWAIGCNDGGAVFEQVEILGTLGWLQVSGAFGKSVTLDRSDNPWVIDSAGGIHKWNGTTFTTWDTSHNWSSLSVGDPNQAVRCMGHRTRPEQVFNFSGKRRKLDFKLRKLVARLRFVRDQDRRHQRHGILLRQHDSSTARPEFVDEERVHLPRPGHAGVVPAGSSRRTMGRRL